MYRPSTYVIDQVLSIISYPGLSNHTTVSSRGCKYNNKSRLVTSKGCFIVPAPQNQKFFIVQRNQNFHHRLVRTIQTPSTNWQWNFRYLTILHIFDDPSVIFAFIDWSSLESLQCQTISTIKMNENSACSEVKNKLDYKVDHYINRNLLTNE